MENSEMRKTILVMDGNNLSYRQSVFSEMKTSTGIHTSVVFSILRGLLSFIKHFDAHGYVFCWDTHKSRRRLRIYPEYKIARARDREDEEQKKKYMEFIAQINMTREVLDFLKIPQVSADHMEADDLMAILAGIISKKYNIILISTDRDLYQCIGPNISVYNPFKKKLFTHKNFNAAIGVSSEQYLFARALMGDKSDGIDGIHGVGDKTAFEIVKSLTAPNLESLKQYISTCEKRSKTLQRVETELSTIERNLKLMRLPMSLHELDKEEQDIVKERVNANLLKCILLNTRQINSDELYSLMSKLELYNVLSEKNLEVLNVQLV